MILDEEADPKAIVADDVDCLEPAAVIFDPFPERGEGRISEAGTVHGADLAVRRIAEVMGEIPLDADGRTFEELRIERAVIHGLFGVWKRQHYAWDGTFGSAIEIDDIKTYARAPLLPWKS